MITTRCDLKSMHVKPRRSVNFCDQYLRNREYGLRPKYGDRSRLFRELYTSLCPIAVWENDGANSEVPHPNNIYKMEFSPDGKLLAAACKNKIVKFFDPITHQLLTSLKNVTNYGVSGVKFLDCQNLVTCSDESTIALWDVRNLKDRIRSFSTGSRRSVLNIEYSLKDNLLVCTDRDGYIYTWDINDCTEEDRKVPICEIDGLTDIKLPPDSSKLIVGTSSGFMIVINDLDMKTLGSDIRGFKPFVYRFMQLTKTDIRNTAAKTHMFTRGRNRIEFIVDFPKHNNAETITSIQVHPQGLNLLSRNVSFNGISEWTCVHDIQKIEIPNELIEPKTTSSQDLPSSVLEPTRSHQQADLREVIMNVNHNNGRRNLQYLSDPFDCRPFHSNNVLRSCIDRFQVPSDQRIHKNVDRLTYYIIESNVGKEILKYPCYSNDGRIICSPWINGVRLLSFSPKCEELSTLQPKLPAVKLHEICTIYAHSRLVSCTNFSPVHPLLVSSCVIGQVVWHQPRL